MAGLFFCLASAEGCRAFALLCCNVATHKRLQRVLCHQCKYTAHAAKQHTGLYRGFSCNFTHSTAHDTKPTQQAIAQPATRWSAYQRPDVLHRYQIPPPHRALYSSTQTAYYNNVYKGAPLLWIHARRYGRSQTMPARRGQLLSCVDRWQVLHPAYLLRGQRLNLYRVSPTASRCFQRPAACNLAHSTRRGSPAAGAQQAARNHWRLSPQLFSGFRPIANRGQQ